MPIEPGDWITAPLNVHASRNTYDATKQPLGGPWIYGRVKRINDASYSVDACVDSNGVARPTKWIMKPSVLASFISRGEADLFVTALGDIERDFIRQRDALRPSFEAQIVAFLNSHKGEAK